MALKNDFLILSILDGSIHPLRSHIDFLSQCFDENWWRININEAIAEMQYFYN